MSVSHSVLRSAKLAATCALVLAPAGALAGDLGFARLTGSYLDRSGADVPFRGYIAVIDTRSRALAPVASAPQLDRCPAAGGPQAAFPLESTVAWAKRSHVMLAISATFQVPKGKFDNICETPVTPFRNGAVELDAPNGVAAPYLAIAQGKAPAIGYAQKPPQGYSIVLSGNSFRMNKAIVPKSLLLQKGEYGEKNQPFPLEPHPRMAAGVRGGDGFLYVLYIEGRTGASAGVTLPVLAELLRECGVTDAVNFDGGGTAQLAYNPHAFPGASSLKPIDVSQLCRPSEHPRVRSAWTPEPLSKPFMSPPIDNCRTKAEACVAGHEHRPLSVSYGFDPR